MPAEVADVEKVSQCSGIHTLYSQSRGFSAAFLLGVITLKYL